MKISRLLCCLINPKLLIADVYVCTDCLSPASNITLFIWICFEQSVGPESTANGYDHSVTSLDGRVTHRVTQVLSHWFVEPGTVHCTQMASSHQISAQRSTFSHWGFIPLKLGLYWEVLGFQLGLGCPKNIKNILVETVGISDSYPVPILSKVTIVITVCKSCIAARASNPHKYENYSCSSVIATEFWHII